MVLNTSRTIIAIITLLSIIVGAGYFYLQKNLLKSTESVVFFSDTDELESLYANSSSDTTVVYFWDSECPCNAGVLPHFNTLVKNHSTKGVRFLLADVSESQSSTRPDIPLLEAAKLEQVKATITHTPSTAIWNDQGELVYYGAHNLGYICNAETSFIQQVLNGIFNKQTISALNTMGEGCFCARE